MLCRSAAAACSLRLAAGTEGAAADSLQNLLVLSSDTFPPPTTAAAHKYPPPSTSLLSSSSPPPALPQPSTSKEALGIWKLTLTVCCCFRESKLLRHVLGGWGGNGTLPCLFGQSYSLFIQTRTPDSSQQNR